MQAAPLVFKEFEISFKTYGVQKSRLHKHAYFELLYVIDGYGHHLVNENHFKYQPGNMFVLTPEDAHGFEPEEPTKMLIIDFTKLFLYKEYRKITGNEQLSDFFREAEHIFQQYNLLKSVIAFESGEQPLITSLIGRLTEECDSNPYNSQLIIYNIVFLLLSLTAKLISRTSIISRLGQTPPGRFSAMVQYIHENIYEPQKLKMEAISGYFNKNKDHLSVYFKQHSGMTMKEYILKYKVDLIKTRLLYSNMNMAEIAFELGLNDESHLNKLFKRACGQTAKAYKTSHGGYNSNAILLEKIVKKAQKY